MPVMILVPYFYKLMQVLGFDPYFDYNTNLLPMEGPDGSKTITDVMGTPVDVGTVKLVTSESKVGNSSAYFDISTTPVGLLQPVPVIGTKDFTIEFWFKPVKTITSCLMDMSPPGSYGPAPLIAMESGKLNLYYNQAYPISATFNPDPSQWYHVVLCRNAGTTRMFLNGVVLGSFADTTNITASTVLWGANNNYGRARTDLAFNGYMDNCRITVGLGRYVNSFNPDAATYPISFSVTSGDPYIEANNFLSHFEGADGAHDGPNTTYLNTATGTMMAITGPVLATNTVRKFGSTCVSSAAGAFITLPTGAMSFGTGDFTLECWVNTPTTSASYRSIIDSRLTNADATGGATFGINPNGTIYWFTDHYVIQSTATIPNNAWSHIALVRKSGTVTMFMDGVAIGTAADAKNYTNPGTLLSHANGTETYIGYIDEVRITKGVARYASNFAAPTAAFADNVQGDASFASVTTLMHFESGANGPGVTTDVTGKNLMTTTGGAVISAAQKMFGTTSLYVPATVGAGVQSRSASTTMAFGTDDFTIEAWVYMPTTNTTYRSVASSRPSNGGQTGAGVVTFNANGQFGWYCNSSYAAQSAITVVVPNNRWTHIACVRSAGVVTLFMDGAVVASGPDTTNYTSSLFTIGSNADGTEAFGGYIDDLRITRGVARYATAYQPVRLSMPDVALPATRYAQGYGKTDPFVQKVTFAMGAIGSGASGIPTNTVTGGTLYSNLATAVATDMFVRDIAYKFVGTGYIQANVPAAFSVSGADTTFEMWINPSVVSGLQTIIDTRSNSSATDGVVVCLNGAALQVQYGSLQLVTVGSVIKKTWSHLAIVKSGPNVNMYLNGTQTATIPFGSIGGPTNYLCWIGSQAGFAGQAYTGSISGMRVTSAARYSVNFIPVV